MSQSFNHCWRTPLIIWGPPSVVMWSGMFHVAQKSFKMVTKCWPSNLPGGVEMMVFQCVTVNLSAITRKL